MGFFSSLGGISGALGGSSTGGSTSTSQSGFGLLPSSIQNAFTGYGSQVSNLFSNPATAQQMFTPAPQNQYETQALGDITQGVAPTQASLNSDIAMQMNPYDSYVTDAINKQSMGQNSLVNQAATQAGQQGSNRSFLGTSDVEQNRLNSIGQFKQQQYNTALNNALGPIAGLKQQDITNLLGAGNFQRGIDTQTQQAPYAALQAYGGLLGALPNSGGSVSNGSSQQQGSSGGLGGLLQTGATLASFFA